MYLLIIWLPVFRVGMIQSVILLFDFFEPAILVYEKCDKILESHLVHSWSSCCCMLLISCLCCSIVFVPVSPIFVNCRSSTKHFLYFFTQPLLKSWWCEFVLIGFCSPPHPSEDILYQRQSHSPTKLKCQFFKSSKLWKENEIQKASFGHLSDTCCSQATPLA